MVELRIPTEDDVEELFRFDGRAFGGSWSDDERARERALIDLDRFRVGVDDGRIVASAGSFAMRLTLPGGSRVPMGGVTWVAVAVTHRRRGVLRRLLDAVHADIDARGEPLAGLTASEGGIYERFGYGVATFKAPVDIDVTRTSPHPTWLPAPPAGSVEVVGRHDVDDLERRLVEVYDRAAARRVGELDRSPERLAVLTGDLGADGVYALHDDGFAAWRVAADWNDGMPRHHVDLRLLVAATSEAHAALWHTLLSLDLVGSIRSSAVPDDDPLPYLLTDPRAVRFRNRSDHLWLDVRDVPVAFGARAYGTDDELVVECDGVRWVLGGDDVRRAGRRRADLVAAPSALGPLLLGSVPPTRLALAGRLEARTTEVLGRADRCFTSFPTPYCSTPF